MSAHHAGYYARPVIQDDTERIKKLEAEIERLRVEVRSWENHDKRMAGMRAEGSAQSRRIWGAIEMATGLPASEPADVAVEIEKLGNRAKTAEARVAILKEALGLHIDMYGGAHDQEECDFDTEGGQLDCLECVVSRTVNAAMSAEACAADSPPPPTAEPHRPSEVELQLASSLNEALAYVPDATDDYQKWNEMVLWVQVDHRRGLPPKAEPAPDPRDNSGAGAMDRAFHEGLKRGHDDGWNAAITLASAECAEAEFECCGQCASLILGLARPVTSR